LSLNGSSNPLLGNHGFNNSIESMRAVFLGKKKVFYEDYFKNTLYVYSNFKARGPNFKRNKKMSGFINVDVYPLICNLIRIDCNPNNGTLKTFEEILNNSNTMALSNLLYNFSLLIVFLSNTNILF
jgi:hypothetical protein